MSIGAAVMERTASGQALLAQAVGPARPGPAAEPALGAVDDGPPAHGEQPPQQGLARFRFLRWWSFGSTVLCMLCGGTLYLFGAYASELRSSLGFTQTEVNVVASAGGFGLYLSGPLMGAAVDKHGARRTALLASLMLSAGYSFMAWAIAGTLPLRSVVFVSLYYGLVGLGSAGAYNAALKTSVQNFDPKDHGFAVGVSVSAFGLSALVFSALSRLFVSNDANSASPVPRLDVVRFLMFTGIVTGSINMLAGLFGLQDLSKIRRVIEHDGAADYPRHPRSTSSPLPAADPSTHGRTVRARDRDQDSTVAVESDSEQRDEGAPGESPGGQPSFLSNTTAWTLFLPFTALSGMGLMYINNIGSIVIALTADSGGGSASATTSQALMVSLISLFNCMGRIVTGVLSDRAQLRYGTPRIAFLVGSGAVILAAQLMGLLFVSSIPALAVCTCVLGFGYGAVFSSTPAIVSQWFGVRHFGSHWGYFQIGPAMGGYIWNVLFGVLMDAERRQMDPPGSDECAGPRCFRGAFLVCALVALASVAALWRLQRARSGGLYSPVE
ncbi:hypothetical protein HK105_203778 [Polyrhizophydium stewartii]|uniref:Major facilitator superfamily (MFS) profile domain-containing protein n=1 Tax=Polyrhizophydium stewartii TaxID=2732419 RepID=A0ABR4NB01_9FUNG